MRSVRLKRIARKATYTIGKLYIDGCYVCDTLEPIDRGLTQKMSLAEILRKKVPGKTAIPTGLYRLDFNTVSPKFKDRSWAKPYGGRVPRILGIPGFDGVLFHPGTTAADTSACPLVGENKAVGKVLNSQKTFARLMEDYFELARKNGDSVWLSVE
ncbi:MAG: DUF5675 family protein [Bacteroidales bacterium]|nr:DUF5675 family protein [Bacteroidales bacterium]